MCNYNFTKTIRKYYCHFGDFGAFSVKKMLISIVFEKFFVSLRAISSEMELKQLTKN